MPKIDNTEHWLNAAIHEYDMLREEMRMFLGNCRKDTQIVGAVICGLTAAYVVKSGEDWTRFVSLIVPSLLFAYFMLQMCNLYMCSVEARASARIEKKIHERLGNWPMDWESNIGVAVVRKPFTPVSVATLSLLLLVVSIFMTFSVVCVFRFGWWTISVHGAEFLLLAVAFSLYLAFEKKESLPLGQ